MNFEDDFEEFSLKSRNNQARLYGDDDIQLDSEDEPIIVIPEEGGLDDRMNRSLIDKARQTRRGLKVREHDPSGSSVSGNRRDLSDPYDVERIDVEIDPEFSHYNGSQDELSGIAWESSVSARAARFAMTDQYAPSSGHIPSVRPSVPIPSYDEALAHLRNKVSAKLEDLRLKDQQRAVRDEERKRLNAELSVLMTQIREAQQNLSKLESNVRRKDS